MRVALGAASRGARRGAGERGARGRGRAGQRERRRAQRGSATRTRRMRRRLREPPSASRSTGPMTPPHQPSSECNKVSAPNMLPTSAGDHAATSGLISPAPPRSEKNFRHDIKHEAGHDATRNGLPTPPNRKILTKRSGHRTMATSSSGPRQKRLKLQAIAGRRRGRPPRSVAELRQIPERRALRRRRRPRPAARASDRSPADRSRPLRDSSPGALTRASSNIQAPGEQNRARAASIRSRKWPYGS